MPDASRQPAHPHRSPDVFDELLADGSMMLYHTGSRSLMTLNPTAALVWDCCDGHHTAEAIVSEVQTLFPYAPAVADSVAAVLRDLRAHGMLRLGEEAA